VAGNAWVRSVASALLDAASVPPPASGTDTTSTWSWPNIAVVMGSLMAPWVAATCAFSAATASLTPLPPRSVPVTTTSAG
jgi:hypothetical protein